MNPLYPILVIGYTLATFFLILKRVRFYWVLGSLLILSQIVCVYDIIIRQPSQITWLCNVAVFLNIFLLFKFKQRVFDLFFYFTWIGCFYICLMPINPYSIAIQDQPVIWIAYWIKHITPLLMTIYFIRIEKRKLSHWSMYIGVVGFLSYCLVIYFYNVAFNENILYLNEPAPFMEPLGPHYFMIIIPIGYYWLGILYLTASLLNGVKSKGQYMPKDRFERLSQDEITSS